MGQFQPGQSGNPKGRPRKGDSLAEKAREATKEGEVPLSFLLKVVNGKVKGASVGHRIQAAVELLDRGFGKSSQTVDGALDITHHDDRDPRDILVDRINTLATRASADGGSQGPT